MNRIKAWLRRLDQRIPVRARCGHWARKSEIEELLDLREGWVTVCPKCYAREMSWNKGGE
jgi:hypothetical protein